MVEVAFYAGVYFIEVHSQLNYWSSFSLPGLFRSMFAVVQAGWRVPGDLVHRDGFLCSQPLQGAIPDVEIGEA